MKIKRLFDKFLRVWKEEGLTTAVGRIFHFAGNIEGRRARRNDAASARQTQGDVLFINGYTMEHPKRYRVFHQMEQLKLAGVPCRVVFVDDLELEMEQNYQVFLFYRCECTEIASRFIDLARSHSKKICFDVDDLVTDTKYTDQVPFVQELTPLNRKLFDSVIMRTGETLTKSDIAITTTEELAGELGKVVPQIHINRNTASIEMVACAEKAYQKALKVSKETEESDARIWIGYFSGSLTHNHDFEIVRPVLMRLMKEYPQIGLILAGELEASDELKRYEDRIARMPMTDWRELPNRIIQADINLAPLEDTIFNRCKSEIKWIEAALVRVPTVASRIGAFAVMIEDGVTGVLCDNTEEDWYHRLRELIENVEKRKNIAENAYSYVMKHCTTEAKAEEFGSFMKSILKN